MSVENGTTVIICVFNIIDYHQTDLFVRTEQVSDPYIPLRDASLSHMNSLRASFRMYDFDYSRDTLSVTFHPEVSGDDVTTPSTGGIRVDRQFLNNGAKILLLDECDCLEVMRQVHVEGDVSWIYQHILDSIIVRKDGTSFSEPKGNKLR